MFWAFGPIPGDIGERMEPPWELSINGAVSDRQFPQRTEPVLGG